MYTIFTGLKISKIYTHAQFVKKSCVYSNQIDQNINALKKQENNAKW